MRFRFEYPDCHLYFLPCPYPNLSQKNGLRVEHRTRDWACRGSSLLLFLIFFVWLNLSWCPTVLGILGESIEKEPTTMVPAAVSLSLSSFFLSEGGGREKGEGPSLDGSVKKYHRRRIWKSVWSGNCIRTCTRFSLDDYIHFYIYIGSSTYLHWHGSAICILDKNEISTNEQ